MKTRAERWGFSLVEVTLALGVAAVSLLGIFALLPVGLQANRTAIQQTRSSDLISAVVADLRATPATSPPGAAATSQRFQIAIPANPVAASTTTVLYFAEDGQFTPAITATSRYRMTVSFLPNSGARAATLATLKMTWPAAAAVANAEGSADIFIALDRN